MGNNTRLFTESELEAIEQNYYFDYDSETQEVLVISNNIERTTRHPANERFFINMKIRKITFDVETIKLWLQLKRIKRIYTLPRIQQAVNLAKLLYQPISKSLIIRLIDNPDVSIQRSTK